MFKCESQSLILKGQQCWHWMASFLSERLYQTVLDFWIFGFWLKSDQYQDPIMATLHSSPLRPFKVAGPTPETNRAAARTAAWWPTPLRTSRTAPTTSAAAAATCATSTSQRASPHPAPPRRNPSVSATVSTVVACLELIRRFDCLDGSATRH